MIRRKNPSGGAIALAAGAAVLASLALWSGLASAKTTKKAKKKEDPTAPPLGCDPRPYEWDEDQVRDAIDILLEDGERDKALIATEVASSIFGHHPNGNTIMFPPAPNAPPGVDCVWTLVVDLVDQVFVEQNITGILPQPPEEFEWVIHASGDPGYPWEEPSLHADNYPTPSTFIQVKYGSEAVDNLDSLVKAALGSALAMAGMDPSLATGTSSTSKRLRKEMRELISCGAFNDGNYGQTDPVKAGGSSTNTYMMNVKNRGLNWLPYHADNLSRMAQGLSPKRTTSLAGNRLLGANAGNTQMLVWIPAIDLEALAGPVPVVVPLYWSDGTSTKEPPPIIQKLGVDMSGVNLPGGAGC